MPRVQVEFHPDAVEETWAAHEWYRERSPKAASKFLAELEEAIGRIREGPAVWPAYIYGTRRFVLRRFPFSVVYRFVSETVQVVALAHGRRRPGYWRGR